MSQAASPQIRPAPILLWGVLFAVGLGWGSSQLLTKLATSTGHHPLGLTFWQTVIGATVFTAVLVLRRRALPLRRRHLVFYLVCGLLGTALPNGLSYQAIRYLPVGIYAIVLSTVPMMTLVLSLALGLEKPEGRRVLGLGFGLIAVLMITLPQADLPRQGQSIWVLAILAVSFSYAAENAFIAKAKPDRLGALQIVCGLTWGALILITPAVWLADGWLVVDRLGIAEWALIGTSLVHVLAYLGLVWLIGAGGPVFASQVGYVVTGAGVAAGMVVLGERHSLWVWGALGLICLGVALVTPRHQG